MWTDEMVEALRRLWAEGLSTSEIGRVLGVSKNAVVGKSHRLHLAPRPSPIILKPKPAPVVAKGPSCQWPLGHPGEAGFHFCGAPPMAGRPYCEEHCARAYSRPPMPADKVAAMAKLVDKAA